MRTIILFVFVVIILMSCKQSRPESDIRLPQIDLLRHIPFIASPATAEISLPLSVVMDSLLPPAGEQGTQGSCVSWVVGYDVVSYFERDASGQLNYGVKDGKPDPHKVYSPAFLYNYYIAQNYGNNPVCTNGIPYSQALTILENNGICSWADCPYVEENDGCSGGLSDQNMAKAKFHNNYEGQRIPFNIYWIQKCIYEGYPVMISLYVPQDFYHEGIRSPKNTPYIWNPIGQPLLKFHAMLIIGYDQKYFEIQNSYGDDWGIHGRAWVPHQALLSRTQEVMILKRKGDPGPLAFEPVKKLINLTGKNSFDALLPKISKLDFDNFSLKIGQRDTDVNKVFLQMYDSSSRRISSEDFVQTGTEKKFYIGDSMVTVAANISANKKNPIKVKVRVDSGELDENLKHVDSMLKAVYTGLQKKTERTESEEVLLREFERWKTGYKIDARQRSSFLKSWYLQLTAIFFSVGFSLLGLLWWRYRKKKQNRTL